MKRYILYGAGTEAEKFIYNYKDLLSQIEYCIDASKTGYFHNIPIYTLDTAPTLENHMILVTARWDLYKEIRNILFTKNLREFDNFIWCNYFDKKKVVINANCHGAAIEQYLNLSPYFRNHFCITPIPLIQENKAGSIDKSLLLDCDVFIHQDIQAANSISYYLSDEYIIPLLKNDCLNITIPNMVGMGNWCFPSQGKILRFPNLDRNICFENSVLEEAYSKGARTLMEFENFFNNYTYNPAELNALFSKDMEKIKQREPNWDIKMSSFILENYKEIPLFNDAGHPSKYTMLYIAKIVAQLLGINDITDYSHYDPSLGIPYPILPCVKQHFHLEYENDYELIANHMVHKPSSCTLSDYIKYYFWFTRELIL